MQTTRTRNFVSPPDHVLLRKEGWLLGKWIEHRHITIAEIHGLTRRCVEKLQGRLNSAWEDVKQRHPMATLTFDPLDDKAEGVAHVHPKRGREAVLSIRPDCEMYRHVQGLRHMLHRLLCAEAEANGEDLRLLKMPTPRISVW